MILAAFSLGKVVDSSFSSSPIIPKYFIASVLLDFGVLTFPAFSIYS